MGKALCYSFISSNTADYDAKSPHENPYNTLSIGLHDKFINRTPLFTPTWFSGAFIALFGCPCYILTQCGIKFATFLFIQATITLIIPLYKTISFEYNLKQIITIFSCIALGFFNILTLQMVNDLIDTHHHKPLLPLQTSKSLDNFSDNPTSLIIIHTGITSPPPFYTKRPNKLHMTRFKLFPKRRPFLQSNINHRISPLPSSQEQHPTLPNYSTNNATQRDNLTTPTDNLVKNTLVNPDTDIPIKVCFRTNYPFPPPSF